MEEKKNTKSLVLYTALIFLVAILMIVISYFSTRNQTEQTNEYIGENSEGSISEKVADLSEENMVLLNTIDSLNGQNQELLKSKEELNSTITNQNTVIQNIKLLIVVQNQINEKSYSDAYENFKLIDAQVLDEDQTKLYNNLNKILNKKFK